MDSTVNDFFNEIDKIVPRKEPEIESLWQKCIDTNTGYSYYWNVKTNEVTWTVPKDLKNEKLETNNLAPPTVSPLFPSVAAFVPKIESKIYKIQDDSKCVLSTSSTTKVSVSKDTAIVEENKREVKSASPDIERKVILLPGYDDTDSEPEIIRTVKVVDDLSTVENQKVKSNSCNVSDNEEEELVSKIQNRMKVLKNLGGDVTSLDDKQANNSKMKEISGFSLVAGYGDSEEEDEEIKSVLPKPIEQPVPVGHSILFPNPKPIDVAMFAEVPKEEVTEEVIDTRAFQRKRRIGIDLINKRRKIEKDDDVDNNARQGFGFKSDDNLELKKGFKSDYPGFKSGGVMFTKSETINEDSNSNQASAVEESDEIKKGNFNEIESTRKTLNEKLTFLNEGREAASPVQVMLIQLETLYTAMKAGSLTTNYLNNWLKETCAELVTLEKDAAPDGWLLQWDRTNKRYFYRNPQTGKTQWDYPQPDVVRDDDAMDISTTPPPAADDILSESTTFAPIQPPLPPRIKSPSPPPPPKITEDTKKRKKKSSNTVGVRNIILPETKSLTNEPLPPGVDSFESTYIKPQKEAPKEAVNTNDALGSALDSFYSDLAAMETEVTTVGTTNDTVVEPKVAEVPLQVDVPSETIKKKKRPKTKLAQGLAMQKKGVSKLVERWKSVQKEY